MPHTRLTLTESQEDGAVTLRVAGPLEHFTCRQLRERVLSVLEDRPTALYLDVAGVTEFDSSGLGVVIGAFKRCQDRGVQFEVQGGTERIRRVFALTGMDRVIPNDWTVPAVAVTVAA